MNPANSQRTNPSRTSCRARPRPKGTSPQADPRAEPAQAASPAAMAYGTSAAQSPAPGPATAKPPAPASHHAKQRPHERLACRDCKRPPIPPKSKDAAFYPQPYLHAVSRRLAGGLQRACEAWMPNAKPTGMYSRRPLQTARQTATARSHQFEATSRTSPHKVYLPRRPDSTFRLTQQRFLT